MPSFLLSDLSLLAPKCKGLFLEGGKDASRIVLKLLTCGLEVCQKVR